VEPLIDLPSGGSHAAESSREDGVRTLANIVSLQDLPKSPVIALTGIGVNGQASQLATEFARLSAQQGYRTVLVHAANDPSESHNGAGFNEALGNSISAQSLLQAGGLETLKVLPTGSGIDDRYPRMTRERIAGVLDDLRADADAIIVVAPSIAETTVEAQLVCAAADLTILAVARGSRSSAVTSAGDALAKTSATLLGAVLVDGASHS
jgi:succinoglycan biosynthesis transport protein ExoP